MNTESRSPDKSSLLSQLRIDRSEPAAVRRSAGFWWALAVAAAIGGAALTTWYFSRSAAVPIRTAAAISFGKESAPLAAASLLDASGYIVARRRATVASKITGKVTEVSLQEGQRVEGGQIIARLDDSNARAALAQSEAQVKQAEAVVTSAQTAYEDALPIFRRNQREKAAAVISAQSFDQAQTQIDAAKSELLVEQRALNAARAGREIAQRNLDDTIIRAPFSGVVTEKAAQAGEMVSPISAGSGFTRTGIGTIVDMNSLEVEVDVSENFIGRVLPQQPVRIKLNAYADWDIPGSVIATIPTADRAKATVKVRIAILAKDPRILPDMGARVSFLSTALPETTRAATPPQASGLTIPAEAIATSGGISIVYVVHGSVVERCAVQLGAKSDAGQTVLAGLQTGSVVAVGDLSRLTDGAKVRVVK
ncbi:MAG TPA: efflux RND transporter periplasmic adaptor subunit [Steroidobacteraceae bacterium]